MARFVLFGRDPAREAPDARPRDGVPDWAAADPARIERALARALALPSGGWAVLDASDRVTRAPRRIVVAGRAMVVWQGPDGPRAAPEACPHMGASLCEGRVDPEGRIVCPWHGLALGAGRRGAWAPFPTHDDGVLAWVRLPELLAPGERATDAPILAARPARSLRGVIRMEARCAPRDVLANRLDPWHGVHFHPHSFLRLRVVDEDEAQITVRVVYKVLGPLAMEVDARFHCPDPRTIVMTIVRGDGVGSVVETHATPLEPGRTAVIEATLATSDRALFPLLSRLGRVARPLIEARAARLWVDDRAYAERTYALREALTGPTAQPAAQLPSGRLAMKPRGGIE
ncbi:MAG: Rieske (2Fe-2S) protein [Sandaracinaceae bacterium]|nr:Rieske (2Fe-2S) protein [Sandaracinaceae bacterium]